MIKGITKGANLANIQSFSATWATNRTDAKNLLNTLPIGTYTLSCVFALTSRNDVTDASVYGVTANATSAEGFTSRERWNSKTVGDSAQYDITFQVTEQNHGNFSAVYFYGCGVSGVGASGAATVDKIMLNSGSQPLPYEPYQTAHDITRIAMWDNGVEHEGWEVRDQQGTILWAADKTLTGTDSIPLKGYGLPLKGIEIEGNETQAATQSYTLTAEAATIDYQSDGSNLTGVGFGGNMSQTGTPTPTVPITPEECGEKTGNLTNQETVETANANTSLGSQTGLVQAIKSLTPGIAYTLSWAFTSTSTSGVRNQVRLYNGSQSMNVYIDNGSSFSLTSEQIANVTQIIAYFGNAGGSMSTFMLNSGSSPLPYEPYGYKIPFQNGSTSYNIYLKEPLRKIGDYKDSVGSDGVVTRRIKKLTLTGQEYVYIYANADISFRINTSDMIINYRHGLSTQFAWQNTPAYSTIDGITLGAGDANMYFTVSSQTASTYGITAGDSNSFKAFLTQQYQNGTPVTVWYVLATPTTESTTIPTVATTSGSNTLTANTTLAPSSITIAATSAVWPGNPIQPEECGEKTGNLMDLEAFLKREGATYTKNGDTFTINMSSNLFAHPWYVSDEDTYLSISGIMETLSGANIRIYIVKKDGTVSGSIALGGTGDVRKTQNRLGAGIKFDYTTIGQCTVSNLMLNTGPTALLYEPYGFKLPLTLAGTTQNVYLDAPLRKIGTYADKLNADGTVTRRVKKLVLDGTENFYQWDNGLIYLNHSIISDADRTDGVITSCCSHFKAITNRQYASTLSPDCCSFRSKNVFFAMKPVTLQFVDLNAFKQWASDEYASNTPVTIWYVLSEPTTEQTTIPTLTPNTGADTLTVDTSLPPSNTEITLHAKPIRYGFKIDKTNDNSDTAVTYTYDAVTMTPAAMNFTTGEFNYGSWANAWFVRDAYPVALNLDGTEAYRLDPDDYTKKTDGTASDIQFVLLSEEPSDWSTQWKQYYTKDANDNYELNAQSEAPTFALNTYYKLSYGGFQGNFMVAFPRVYFRRTEDATYNYVEISNHKLGDDWYAYAHINSSGNEVKRIYLPLFKGVIVDSKLRSVPGVIPQGGTTASVEVTAASALGSRWQIWDHSSAELINDLLILMSKSIDSQGKFGKGRESGYDSTDTVTYGKLQTGTLVKGGKFKGFSSSYKEVKVFGMEGFWANRWDRLQGMLLVDNVWKIKMTPPYNFTGTDFVTLSSASVPSGNGYLSKVQTSQYGSIPASIEGGGSSKFYKDYFYKTATSTRVALRGGNCSNGAVCGFRYVGVYLTASTSIWAIGASPLYK